MTDERSPEELIDEFVENWQEKRHNANAIEEFYFFLEEFSEYLADYSEEKHLQLVNAIWQGMAPITRLNFLVFMTAAVMIRNIRGDHKVFLHDFILKVEHLFAKMQADLSHPPSLTLLH